MLGAGLGRASTRAGFALAPRLWGAVVLEAALGLFWGLCWSHSLCPSGTPQRDACCAVSWISLAKASLKVTR